MKNKFYTGVLCFFLTTSYAQDLGLSDDIVIHKSLPIVLNVLESDSIISDFDFKYLYRKNQTKWSYTDKSIKKRYPLFWNLTTYKIIDTNSIRPINYTIYDLAKKTKTGNLNFLEYNVILISDSAIIVAYQLKRISGVMDEELNRTRYTIRQLSDPIIVRLEGEFRISSAIHVNKTNANTK